MSKQVEKSTLIYVNMHSKQISLDETTVKLWKNNISFQGNCYDKHKIKPPQLLKWKNIRTDVLTTNNVFHSKRLILK